KIGAIEADFNNMTGNIPFRADFSNPEGLLRNGQTGTILIHRTLQNLLVIPQRATFEILAKRYAFVVDKDNVVHQRDIEIKGEQDDIFVLKSGLKEGEKIILEGIRQVKDGDKIKYDFRDPKEVLSNLKYHAE
ncbi:MAG: efflux RND transporter periplasmic adaptor subunit, partial [Gimesia chilikensis]